MFIDQFCFRGGNLHVQMLVCVSKLIACVDFRVSDRVVKLILQLQQLLLNRRVKMFILFAKQFNLTARAARKLDQIILQVSLRIIQFGFHVANLIAEAYLKPQSKVRRNLLWVYLNSYHI